MADQNTSLPVRTESNGDVVAKIADATTPSQQLAIDASGRITDKLNDGSGNPITSQASGGQRALDVGIDVGGVQVDPRSIRTLTSADTVTVVQPTAANLNAQVQGPAASGSTTSGNPLLNGAVFNTTQPTVTNGQIVDAQATARGALIVATGVDALKANIQDSSGNPFSASNPLFVTLSDVAGAAVDSYNTASAIAAGASSNHDYTVTAAKTFYSKQIWATASGKLKVEVQYETAAASGTFNSFWVGFNSTADPNILIPLPSGKTQVTGARIRVIRTNEDKNAMDLYSTISGAEQ